MVNASGIIILLVLSSLLLGILTGWFITKYLSCKAIRFLEIRNFKRNTQLSEGNDQPNKGEAPTVLNSSIIDEPHPLDFMDLK